jgi:hypothetical protein
MLSGFIRHSYIIVLSSILMMRNEWHSNSDFTGNTIWFTITPVQNRNDHGKISAKITDVAEKLQQQWTVTALSYKIRHNRHYALLSCNHLIYKGCRNFQTSLLLFWPGLPQWMVLYFSKKQLTLELLSFPTQIWTTHKKYITMKNIVIETKCAKISNKQGLNNCL